MIKDSEGKVVRFYFELGIDYVFPENPKTDTSSDDEWITDRCWLLCEEIQKKLPSTFDVIQFARFKKVMSNKNIFTIYFSISEYHDFTSNEIYSPRKGYNGFKIKKHSLLKAKKSIEIKIRSSLYEHYFIETLSIKYITSRDFIFELFFEGIVTVEKVFSQEEINEEGGVSYALEVFFNEMYYSLQECGMESHISQTNKRRNRNNKYVFEVNSTAYYGFSESEVIGEMALLEHNMSINEVQMIGIDTKQDALNAITADAIKGYELMLNDILPTGLELFRFHFSDQDDDVYDVCDELLIDYKDIKT